VAVVTTCGSGAGSAATDVELESVETTDEADIAEAVEAEARLLLEAGATGAGVALAMGLRSVVASTTI
jgi:hypothetical protein